jgi:thiol-disulfide isomerase/thioredoxin
MTLKSLFASSLVLLGALSTAFAEATWLTNFEEAKAIAVKEGKPLLLDFTGSDWCPPCKLLHKNVFSTEEFAKEAAGKYVLVELDFPRTKQLAPELKAQNSELQKKYAITGYPTVLLVDAKTGEVFGRSVGFGGQNARQFLDKLASFKNTPEGKASLVEEEKKADEARSKANAVRAAANAKIKAAVDAKDFDAACKAIDEVAGGSKLMAALNKATASQSIDPSNKERALKYLDEAIAVDGGRNAETLKQMRDRVANGGSIKSSAPAAKPAAEAKKADKGA